MKRWIHASTGPDVFNTSSTNMSYYDQFLDPEDLEHMQKNKNLTGHIEMMTPSEYFKECGETSFQRKFSVDELKSDRSYSHFKDGKKLVDKYAEDMINGDKFPLCFINYADPGQEGLHRMYAAGEAFGWDAEFPVLVIEPYDMDRWERMKFYQAVDSYRRYDFKDIVKIAVSEISDWDKPVPPDFEDLFRQTIRKVAAKADKPHDIDVQLKIDDGLVLIYLTEYDGEDVHESSFDDKAYLEDMFDTTEKDIDDLLDEDDLDLSTYFFKEGIL